MGHSTASVLLAPILLVMVMAYTWGLVEEMAA